MNQLRLPEHRTIGRRPERDPAWVPQNLWVDALPPSLGTRATPLHRACLAMALAKLGTAASWAEIAASLQLPATLANSIGAVLRSWARAGTWPTIHTHLDMLLQNLQKTPPGVDYQRRRELGRDIDLLDRALTFTAETHPSPLPHEQLRRVFWEVFIGGDIAYTAAPLAIDPGHSEYATYRCAAADSVARDLPRLQASHNEITRLTGQPLGRLNWTPQQIQDHRHRYGRSQDHPRLTHAA